MSKFSIFIIASVFIQVLFILLQIRLAKKKSAVPGLVLPSLSFIISLCVVFVIIAFTNVVGVGADIYRSDRLIEHLQSISSELPADMPAFILSAAANFFIWNIPTVIYLAIYFVIRGRARKSAKPNKLNIAEGFKNS